jgi:hypothetical protein
LLLLLAAESVTCIFLGSLKHATNTSDLCKASRSSPGASATAAAQVPESNCSSLGASAQRKRITKIN